MPQAPYRQMGLTGFLQELMHTPQQTGYHANEHTPDRQIEQKKKKKKKKKTANY